MSSADHKKAASAGSQSPSASSIPRLGEVRDAAAVDADDVVATRATQQAGGEGGADTGGAGDRGGPAGGSGGYRVDVAQTVQGDVVRAADVAPGPFVLLADVDELDGVVEQSEGEAVEVPGVGFGDREPDLLPSDESRPLQAPDRLQKPTACRRLVVASIASASAATITSACSGSSAQPARVPKPAERDREVDRSRQVAGVELGGRAAVEHGRAGREQLGERGGGEGHRLGGYATVGAAVEVDDPVDVRRAAAAGWR